MVRPRSSEVPFRLDVWRKASGGDEKKAWSWGADDGLGQALGAAAIWCSVADPPEVR